MLPLCCVLGFPMFFSLLFFLSFFPQFSFFLLVRKTNEVQRKVSEIGCCFFVAFCGWSCWGPQRGGKRSSEKERKTSFSERGWKKGTFHWMGRRRRIRIRSSYPSFPLSFLYMSSSSSILYVLYYLWFRRGLKMGEKSYPVTTTMKSIMFHAFLR